MPTHDVTASADYASRYWAGTRSIRTTRCSACRATRGSGEARRNGSMFCFSESALNENHDGRLATSTATSTGSFGLHRPSFGRSRAPGIAPLSDVADGHAPDRRQATARRSPGRPLPWLPVWRLRRPRQARTRRTFIDPAPRRSPSSPGPRPCSRLGCESRRGRTGSCSLSRSQRAIRSRRA